MENKNPKGFRSSLTSFRRVFIWIIVINAIFVIQRTVFDFMGFMFGMIIADLAYLLFLIIGIFGAIQYRVNYIVICTLMSLAWIGWNIFVICVNLNIGILNRYDPSTLNLNTGKKSWFFVSSFGCRTEVTSELEMLQFQDQLSAVRSLIQTSMEPSQLSSTLVSSTKIINPNQETNSDVDSIFDNDHNKYKSIENFIQKNCILPFYLIEIIQSGIFIFSGILTVIFGLLLSNAFNEEDDTFDYIGGFETAHIVSNNFVSDTAQITLPRNGHIRLEPLYA